MQTQFQLAFNWHSDVHLLEIPTTQEPSSQAAMFLFAIESCEHQVNRLERFCMRFGPAEGSTGDGRFSK